MNLETFVSTTSKFMKMIVARKDTGLNIVDHLFLKPIFYDSPGNPIKSHDSWRLASEIVPFFLSRAFCILIYIGWEDLSLGYLSNSWKQAPF